MKFPAQSLHAEHIPDVTAPRRRWFLLHKVQYEQHRITVIGATTRLEENPHVLPRGGVYAGRNEGDGEACIMGSILKSQNIPAHAQAATWIWMIRNSARGATSDPIRAILEPLCKTP